MGKNTGEPYEHLTKDIFDQLVNQTEVDTVKLKHNVKLQGKTTTHQIDVYWEFDRGGIKYVTIVQAKDWQQPVKQGQLLQFKGVLDDLPFQATGIFVTLTGYQQGARNYARGNGILLYELREPTEVDWEGKVKTIVIRLEFFFRESSDINFVHDKEWVAEERHKRGISEDEPLKLCITGRTDETLIYDEDGQKITTLKDIINSFVLPSSEEISSVKKKHSFSEPAFIHTGIEKFPKLKLKALEATISVSKDVEEIRLNGEDIVGFILKNTLEGSQYTFDKNRKLRK